MCVPFRTQWEDEAWDVRDLATSDSGGLAGEFGSRGSPAVSAHNDGPGAFQRVVGLHVAVALALARHGHYNMTMV